MFFEYQIKSWLSQLMYSMLRSKTDYEAHAWKSPSKNTAALAEEARMSA